jgi:endonuclease/exonuclease/phosphatase (EEP) superfamily protein YafD
MVANVLGGGADPAAVAKVIQQRKPDLVSLPEAQVGIREEIQAHLKGLVYNGYTQQSDESAVSATSVLVSSSLGAVRFSTDDTATNFGHIVITGGRLGDLRLIAYHGYPPLPDEVTRWKQDLDVLKGWCAHDPPTIVAGDFNATTDHADFRRALGPNCRSVAPSVGAGLQGTWPSDRPALARTQIDHVVVTRGLQPGRFTTYKIVGSDHRAVVATVAVPRTG